ncbi:Nodulation protein nolO [Indibacter alkaliphilus LW1]|uniref:Nodulation protein nolO n=1 Tax=Indibacter alkaliphilus (strain CCUG 57479 / KCTC 22604 / LW1) TaxID=1189612 RepID=S2DU98_INDAL|nr:carbamoyltransferase [Indibacter alkaliphilus]EOZ95641.1 Nodulation protein nolO [Indibacter alkaliphilus LW1]
MKKILGLSAFYHDSAAAILIGGEIIAAAQEERFTRQKHTPDFPIHSIRYCLEEAGLSIDELDAVVFYDKPLLKFERLLETYYAFAPKGLVSFLKAIPVWLDEKMFLKKLIKDGLQEVGGYDKNKLNLLFSEHHLSHAASAYFPSKFQKAAVLTIDGVGEWSTASIGLGEGNNFHMLKELEFPHSVGLLYSAFTYFLGFTVNSGEYKLMGLAPYGNPDDPQTSEFEKKIKENLVDIKEDGSIWLDQKFFNYATGLRMVKDESWKSIFGFKRREPEDQLEQYHCNLALAIQRVTEEIVIKMALTAKRICDADYLCLAGGVALNCVANGKLLQKGIFKDIYIQPAAGDAGGALGAALAVSHLYFGEERVFKTDSDQMKGSYLGPEYSEKEIQLMNRKVKAVCEKYSDFHSLAQLVASKIAEGKVIGWFQGRMEFGPRALGNRSIIGDARNPEMQKKLNLKIKYREGFRPFAPSVLAEKCGEYFDLNEDSPYMLIVAPVLEKRRKLLPENYHQMDLWEKLYRERSDIQSVTHLDFSARIQTVHKETNSRYWRLIAEFERQTGFGLVVNTSFNVRGEPVVCTPFDAYRCFMSTEMDYLVIGDFVYIKNQQPDWGNREKWMVEFKPD